MSDKQNGFSNFKNMGSFNTSENRSKKGGKSVLTVFVVIIGILVAMRTFAVIPANTVGIVVSPISGTQEEPLSEGLSIINPLDSVKKISTTVQTKTLEGISGQTQDSQFVTMTIDVKYQVNPANAVTVFKQFKDLHTVSNVFIAPVTQKAIDSVLTQYNVMEVLGSERNQINKEIEEELREKMAEAGIDFYSITFIDTDGGATIEAAIAAEAVAKKAVETAEQEKLKIEIEAQQRVIEAQADLDKAKIEAEKAVVEASAEAEANRLIAQSITQELIDKIEAEARLEHGWVEVLGGSAIVDTREYE